MKKESNLQPHNQTTLQHQQQNTKTICKTPKPYAYTEPATRQPDYLAAPTAKHQSICIYTQTNTTRNAKGQAKPDTQTPTKSPIPKWE